MSTQDIMKSRPSQSFVFQQSQKAHKVPLNQKKVQEIIRKKMSLYGFEELSNPLFYNRQSIYTSLKQNNIIKQNRAKSSLVSEVKKNTDIIHGNTEMISNRSNSRLHNSTMSLLKKLQPIIKVPKLFPQLNNLQSLVHNQKQILHVFKEKLDNDLNDVVYEYLKILSLSILRQSKLYSQTLSPQKSVLIPTLEFIAQSLFECHFDKVTLIFASIAVSLCQFYQLYERIGKFLFLIAKVLRKMSRFNQTIIVLKKALEYVWYGRRRLNEKRDFRMKNNENQVQMKSSTSVGKLYQPVEFSSDLSILTTTQLQIYNQLSYCLLQVSQKQQSQMFAQKYEIGYLQKQGTSNVMGLSKELLSSAQKRIVSWHRVDQKRIYLMLGTDLQKYLEMNKQRIMKKFTEEIFLQDIKANLDLIIQNLLKKEMFFYEVPLVTQFRDKDIQNYKKSHSTGNRIRLQHRFVFKPKSTSHKRSSSIPVKNQKKVVYNTQNVGQNKIFNYRGVGLSRTKLVTLMKNYINFIRSINKEDNMELGLRLPQLTYDRKSNRKITTQMEESNQFYGKQQIQSRKKIFLLDSLND